MTPMTTISRDEVLLHTHVNDGYGYKCKTGQFAHLVMVLRGATVATV